MKRAFLKKQLCIINECTNLHKRLDSKYNIILNIGKLDLFYLTFMKIKKIY